MSVLDVELPVCDPATCEGCGTRLCWEHSNAADGCDDLNGAWCAACHDRECSRWDCGGI